MPNWCYNSVYITGSKKDLDEIEAIGFDFHKIIPMPQDMYEDSQSELNLGGQSLEQVKKRYPDNPEYAEKIQTWIDKYGHDGWYSWSTSNWDTKWSASNVEMKRESNETLTAKFNTSWGPPESVLRKLSKLFPKIELEHSYNIEGSDPCSTYQDGEILA